MIKISVIAMKGADSSLVMACSFEIRPQRCNRVHIF